MRRTAVIVTMLLAMLWQSLALARIGSPVNALADLAHAALHWQGAAHLHMADGTYELDSSSDAIQHVVTDHTSASLALATSPSPAVLPASSAAPDNLHGTAVPDPLLDGLLRPPRHRA